MEHYKEAIEDFQNLLTIEPGNKQAIEELGKINQISQKSPISKLIEVEPHGTHLKPKRESYIPEIKPQRTDFKQKNSQTPFTPFPVNYKVELPQFPPKTAYEFEAFWNSVNGNLETLYKYLKLIPPESFPNLFKESMNSDIFNSLIAVFDQHFLPDDVEGLYKLLQNLALIRRFEVNVMFLSSKETQVLASIFDRLSQAKSLANENLATLKIKYGLAQ